jgi:Fe-S-cluster-containing dehydrogenase component
MSIAIAEKIFKKISVIDSERCVGCQSCMFACARRFGRGGLSKSTILAKSIGGVERGYTVIVCRACPDPPCAKVCPTGAIIRRKYGVLVNASKCIACKHCVEECPFGAVFWDDEANKPAICVHCGYCVDYCPYNVIKMEEVK